MIKKLLAIALIIVFAMPVFAQRPVNNDKQEKTKLPIKKVILYSHGVGYFERQGTVQGTQSIALEFNSGQMNDVLKSLLVLDLNGGLISTVTYDTTKPINKQLEALSLSLADSNERGLTSLIGQMRGARVEVRVATAVIEGKVVGLEKRKEMKGDNVVEIDSLVLATDAGDVRAFDLADIKAVKIIDEKLRSDLAHYLEILNNTHKKDARNLVITAQGDGKRKVMAGYTIEAPIWKTTYRIVIDEKGKPFLQGWAIVDNEQDEDWEDVDLSLVSGLPISFIQDLQSARYRRRPTIPFREELALSPQTYESAQEESVLANGSAKAVGGGSAASDIVEVTGGETIVERHTAQLSNNYDSRRVLDLPTAQPSPTVLLTPGVISSVNSAATGQDVGELFQYKVTHPVTIKRNSSALIPIVAAKTEGERVSIFNESGRLKNPMSGIYLNNTTGLTLESGPLTVFEGDTYGGEGLMDRLKPEEKRFITFAADLGTMVSTNQDNKDEAVNYIEIVNGTFYASNKKYQTKTYTITNKDTHPKTIIVEHPYRDDWELESPKDIFEKTENFYRFRVVVPAKATNKFVVKEEHEDTTSYGISNITPDLLAFYVNKKYVSEEVRQTLQKVIDLKQRIVSTDVEINNKNRQINDIGTDQARIRENLKAVGKTEEEKKLIARYTEKLNQGEDELEKLRKEIKELSEQRIQLQTELNNVIKNLSFNKKL